MKEIDINPNDIGIWCYTIKKYKEPLEAIIRRDGWKNLPRVPIFELPQGYLHKFVLIDGHARHNAATKTNTLLPCKLYTPGESINVARDNLAPFNYEKRTSEKRFYSTILLMYGDYEVERLKAIKNVVHASFSHLR